MDQVRGKQQAIRKKIQIKYASQDLLKRILLTGGVGFFLLCSIPLAVALPSIQTHDALTQIKAIEHEISSYYFPSQDICNFLSCWRRQLQRKTTNTVNVVGFFAAAAATLLQFRNENFR